MATAVAFFAGAGGLDMGMKNAGFDIKLTVELERTYCTTLKNNHPDLKVIEGDIMQYTPEKIYLDAGISPDTDIDLIFGGSPCQSFSTAGKRQAFASAGGSAMLKFAELIRTIRPKMFLLENVKGLLSAPLKHRPHSQRGNQFSELLWEEMPGSALEYLLNQFEGYNINYKLINAADYGVPQTRERVIFVGVRENLNIKYQFPKPTHNSEGIDGKLKWITVGELFKNTDFGIHHYVEYSSERLRYMRMIPQGGGNWRNLPMDIVEKAMGGAYLSGGGKVGFFRRLNVKKPAPTMLTSPIQKSTNLGHPYEDRPLSIEEYLAIQQFPINYKIAGSLTQQYVQIGNAVPVNLAKLLGDSIIETLNRVNLSIARSTNSYQLTMNL
ncbi:DNA (cytosine-5-)-methyltransferase [Paenibacillus sp. CFBP13512]|uniref:DNA cytosine methyltransferase n=1 Tax=Paenibacillus sp. CFBP13512 TaxID=2184007 RepID=UPI0010C12708|nr:DNA cytosine methyltransferase [Paenibacillus sp. CFBP13512]TKJ89749.1 DNA (cytosine-5-)-methyltransferase [Paenibacillus sp. CFBP13512]